MIQVTPQMRILVAVEPVNFRKGIDLCRPSELTRLRLIELTRL